jgi:hypothetical protein
MLIALSFSSFSADNLSNAHAQDIAADIPALEVLNASTSVINEMIAQ